MRFGQRVRSLRLEKGLTLRGLAEKVGVGFTYISKVENGKLDFADYPGYALIVKLAKALDADEDELLILGEKIPDKIRRRVLERPEAFLKLAGLDDRELDRVVAGLEGDSPDSPNKRRKPKGTRK